MREYRNAKYLREKANYGNPSSTSHPKGRTITSNTMNNKQISEAMKEIGSSGGKATLKKIGKKGMKALSLLAVKAREANRKIKSNDQG